MSFERPVIVGLANLLLSVKLVYIFKESANLAPTRFKTLSAECDISSAF